MIHDRPNRAPEIKRALGDPTRLLEALGLLADPRGRQRQASGWLVRCPVHEDRSPSCSVQERKGVLLWKCHACDAGGDALSLIAAVRGLSIKQDFRAVLLEAARLGGLWQIVDELEGRGEAPAPMPAPIRAPEPESDREWPPIGEVEALWNSSRAVSDDAECSAHLSGRGLDPERVASLDIGRALPTRGALPPWARCRGGTWREAGYRLIVPMFDATGALRSVRAWRVTDGDGPKRLPPSGHKAGEMVMADAFGRAMLAGTRKPETVAIVEGEPDFFARCLVSNDPHVAAIGIVSGSWCRAMAERIPVGARVVIRTDHDQAGDRYAEEIERSIARRAFVFRSRSAA